MIHYSFSGIPKKVAISFLVAFLSVSLAGLAAAQQYVPPISGGQCPAGSIPAGTYSDGTPRCQVQSTTPAASTANTSTSQSGDIVPTTLGLTPSGLVGVTCPNGYTVNYDLSGNGGQICLKNGAPTPSGYQVQSSTDTVKGTPVSSSTAAAFNPSLAPTTISQHVDSYAVKYTIPCQPTAGGTCPAESNSSPAAYIVRLYQFGLMIVGLLAFGAIVYGALKYILSAGNMADQSDAKDQITQALWGVVLLLGAYTLLYTINPRLVSLSNPEIVPLNVSALQSPSGNGTPGSQIPTAAGPGGDPLCKLYVNSGININLSTSAGNLGGTPQGCIQCVSNASVSGGTCQCDTGYTTTAGTDNNTCVPLPAKGPNSPKLTAPLQ
ncbi:hypothetical protein KGO95_01560 [Patescibacteria group bacterium]|nr:hypothetical protein [Patescibacteria group bacterium]